jgi:hypothetical protein
MDILITMSIFGAKSITGDERQRILIEFIRSNPYCNAEDVVQGVKDDISRVTVFKVLRRLIESGAVKSNLQNEQKRNSRDHKLFVDENNPLVSLPLELEKFESAYFKLLYEALPKIQLIMDQREAKALDPTMKRKLTSQLATLLAGLLELFWTMVYVCLFQFLFLWSQKISDKKVLQQLYSVVSSKIGDMQIQLSEAIKVTGGGETILDTALQIKIRHELQFGGYLYSFKQLGVEKEIESTLDSLWRLIGDLQPNVYPEPKLYGWSFNYGKDGWRKLMRLLEQHPESEPYRDFRKARANKKSRLDES